MGNGPGGEDTQPAGHPGGARRSGGTAVLEQPASLSLFRASRILDGMATPFVHWFQAFGPMSEALETLETLKPVLAAYTEEAESTALAELRPGPLATVLLGLEFVDQGDGSSGLARAALQDYVDFLADTGRWTGTAQTLEDLQGLLSGETAASVLAPAVNVPDLAEPEETAAWDALPQIGHARALVEWLGAGKDVTATGALRLKDIEEAAACVGVAAVGDRRASAAGGYDDGPLRARSMAEVPRLGTLWRVLVGAGIVRLKSTRAVPGPLAGAFRSGVGPAALEANRAVGAAYYLDLAASTKGDSPWMQTLRMLTVALMLGAASDAPPAVEDFPEAADRAPEPERRTLLFATEALLHRLGAWANDGWFLVDSHVRVPAVLRQCIARAVGDRF